MDEKCGLGIIDEESFDDSVDRFSCIERVKLTFPTIDTKTVDD